MRAAAWPTVAASYAHAVAHARGPQDMGTGAAGTTGGAWASPTQRLPFAEVRRLWELLLGPDEEPHVGLVVGSSLRPADLHVLGHLVLASASLAEAAAAAVRYHRLVSEAGVVSLDRGPQRSRLVYRPTVAPGVMHPQQVEAVVTGMVTAAGWIAPDWAPVSVAFTHRAIGAPGRYTEILRCPVVFDAAENAVTVRTTELDRPRALTDPALTALHRRHADGLLGGLPATDMLCARVRGWLDQADLLRARPEDLRDVLFLSPRTLRRALREEGTSWRELLDEARHMRALQLLRTTDLTLDAVARQVGLSGAAALVRAFTRWHHMTPGAYRRHHAHNGVTSRADSV
ncbi:AraC family transcriptional regulator [Streptomyces glomeratus]|uniref:AraC family transcriptional regulator n=1 Tax=Streptomyces glomeratus TaxID=284452 RepID=A0ABP6LLZ3_9ACTN|nr:AraC family transcriptional regulator [Streptomyces glomeratus]MCF1509794.1 AraC family transcriptional regulator [Streptomyces glomeratus]